jgi:hypothetical protein
MGFWVARDAEYLNIALPYGLALKYLMDGHSAQPLRPAVVQVLNGGLNPRYVVLFIFHVDTVLIENEIAP